MTEVPNSRPPHPQPPVKLTECLVFSSWLEETLYCRLPSRPRGCHEGDLIVRVAYSPEAKVRGLTEIQVRQSIKALIGRGLIEYYRREGQPYLRKAKGKRSVALRFI